MSLTYSSYGPESGRRASGKRKAVARFRYVQSRRVWRLYCQYRDLRWHEYEPLFEARSFDDLLTEVDEDPTGIFWG